VVAKEHNRAQRVADEIHHELARILQREAKNSHATLVTISIVKISKDLAHATVYMSALVPAEEIPGIIAELNKTSSYFRLLLAKTLKLRITPTLRFVYDALSIYSRHLSSLIDTAVAEDATKRKIEGED
jgi:ribosome-binding factor A